MQLTTSSQGLGGNASFSTDFMRQNSQPLVHKPNKMALFLLLLISLLPRSLFLCSQTFSPISFSLSSSLCFCKNYTSSSTFISPLLNNSLSDSGCPPPVLHIFFFFFYLLPMLTSFLCKPIFFFSGSENCEEEPDPAIRFWDELSHVGLPQDLNVQSLFESGKINRPYFFFCNSFYQTLLAHLM